MKRDGGGYTVTIGYLEVKIRRLSHHGNMNYFLASKSARFPFPDEDYLRHEIECRVDIWLYSAVAI